MIFNRKYPHLLLFCLFILNWQNCFAQINYQKFPLNNQVLQRNDQNEAVVSVKGLVTENGHSSVSLLILQDGNTYFQGTVNLDASKTFEFSPTIKAGKINYTVIVYLDGTKEVNRATRVVAGDVFLVYGQSNAMGNGGNEVYQPSKDEFSRFFYVNYYNENDFQWVVPFETFLRPGTGIMELLKFLNKKYDYPIGIISGAVGGAEIKNLNNRNPQNPTDKFTNYGSMLYQTINADVKDKLKYIIYRQGESDNNSISAVLYQAEFEKLLNILNSDFPQLSKFFNFQLDILTSNNDKGGFLRDFQRRTKYLYPKISTLTSVGTTGFDGLHYNLAGYSQTAFELSRIIGREVYNDYQSPQIYSPDIKRAFWENDKLVLEFDDQMQMRYPNDSTVFDYFYSMKDFIYIDDKNDVVKAGFANGNKVYLSVSNVSNAKYVSYLPPYFGDFGKRQYQGTYLKNSLGMRAFSFYNVEIGGQVPILPTNTFLTLALAFHEDIKVKLTWNGNSQTSYDIERSEENESNFVKIASVNGDSYFDSNVDLDKKYYYKITAQNANSDVKAITLKCAETINLKTLPNVVYVGANSSIVAIITINNTKQLSLEANKSIDLNHGFDAELGSNFNAQIGGCKN